MLSWFASGCVPACELVERGEAERLQLMEYRDTTDNNSIQLSWFVTLSFWYAITPHKSLDGFAVKCKRNVFELDSLHHFLICMNTA